MSIGLVTNVVKPKPTPTPTPTPTPMPMPAPAGNNGNDQQLTSLINMLQNLITQIGGRGNNGGNGGWSNNGNNGGNGGWNNGGNSSYNNGSRGNQGYNSGYNNGYRGNGNSGYSNNNESYNNGSRGNRGNNGNAGNNGGNTNYNNGFMIGGDPMTWGPGNNGNTGYSDITRDMSYRLDQGYMLDDGSIGGDPIPKNWESGNNGNTGNSGNPMLDILNQIQDVLKPTNNTTATTNNGFGTTNANTTAPANNNGSKFNNAGDFGGAFSTYLGKQTHAAADLQDTLAAFSKTAAAGKGTGTGLDAIVQTILDDAGLTAGQADAYVRGGAYAANGLNALFAEIAQEMGADADGTFTTSEVQQIGSVIKNNYGELYTALHGDNNNGAKTGFHMVENAGGNTALNLDGQQRNAMNTIFDGIYHFGNDVKNGAFLNEDGNANQTVADVTEWLNALYFKDPAAA